MGEGGEWGESREGIWRRCEESTELGNLERGAQVKERAGGASSTQKLMQPLAGCRTGPTAKRCREAKTRSDCREPESEQGWEEEPPLPVSV